jgi:hypothetical protein
VKAAQESYGAEPATQPKQSFPPEVLVPVLYFRIHRDSQQHFTNRINFP